VDSVCHHTKTSASTKWHLAKILCPPLAIEISNFEWFVCID